MSKYMELVKEREALESSQAVVGWTARSLAGTCDTSAYPTVILAHGSSVHMAMDNAACARHKDALAAVIAAEQAYIAGRLDQIAALLSAADAAIENSDPEL